MHTNSIGCPKIFSLSASVLYWLSHLTCISSLKAKNEQKMLIYTQLKISRYNKNFFAIFRRILINWPPTYLLQSDLFTHFHIFPWQQYAVFRHLSNFQLQNGQFYGCVFHISKDMVLLKMDPQLEGAMEVHPFSQTNMKFKPVSLLLTSTQSLHFHIRNSWIYSVNKNIKKVCQDRKPWFIMTLCFTHAPKSITAGEKTWW